LKTFFPDDHHYGSENTTFSNNSVSPPLLTTPFSPDDGLNSSGHDTIGNGADLYAANHNGHDTIGLEYAVNQ
jgi:hypothetical protein